MIQDQDKHVVDGFSLPAKEAAPDPRPAAPGSPPNLAKPQSKGGKLRKWQKETISEFSRMANIHYARYKKQGRRKQIEDTLKECDLLYRGGKNTSSETSRRKDADSDTTPTLSEVPSVDYYRIVNLRTANQLRVLFPDDKIPAAYEPIPGCPDYALAEGEILAKQWNLIAQYNFEADKMFDTVRRGIRFCNKNSEQIWLSEWDKRKEERVERIQIIDEKSGKKVARRRKVNMTVADHAILRLRKSENVYRDLQVPGMQRQVCILDFDDILINDIYAKAQAGEYANVGEIKASHFFENKSANDVHTEKQQNTESNPDAEKTGGLKRCTIWLRAPIDDEGRWAPDKVLPTWHWGVFIGDIEKEDGAVCVKLIKNPYDDKQNPYHVTYSLDDDLDGVHLSMRDLLISYIWQKHTLIQQLFDLSNEMANNTIISSKGNILGNGVTKFGHKVVEVKDVQGVKNFTPYNALNEILEAIRKCDREMAEIAGTVDSVKGIAAGGRTSATEHENVHTQAILPLSEDAMFIGLQLFGWLMPTLKSRWGQYAPNDLVLSLTGQDGIIEEFKPSHLHGPMKVRLVGVKKWEQDQLTRAEQDKFVQTVLPTAGPDMGIEGRAYLVKEMAAARRIVPDPERLYPSGGEFDAQTVAVWENINILRHGVQDFPKPQENHAAHNRHHEPFLASYKKLPRDEQIPNHVAFMEQHVLMHNQFLEQQQSSVKSAMQQGTPEVVPEAEPQLAGEAAGDLMGELAEVPA